MAEQKERQGAAVNTPNNEEIYSHPQPPPPYEAGTSSNVPHPVYTAGPQYISTGPPIITTGPRFVATGPTVVTTQPGITVMPGTMVGTKPTMIICRSCNCQIVTRVEYIPSMRTHLLAAMCCILGFWPCVCLPYCIDTCNNVDHYCPNCNSYVGRYLN